MFNTEKITEALEKNKIYKSGDLTIKIGDRFIEDFVIPYSSLRFLKWEMVINGELYGAYTSISDKCEIIKNDPILVNTLLLVKKQIQEVLLYAHQIKNTDQIVEDLLENNICELTKKSCDIVYLVSKFTATTENPYGDVASISIKKTKDGKQYGAWTHIHNTEFNKEGLKQKVEKLNALFDNIPELNEGVSITSGYIE